MDGPTRGKGARVGTPRQAIGRPWVNGMIATIRTVASAPVHPWSFAVLAERAVES
jgi:hypothetical protein